MIVDIEDFFTQGCGRCARFTTPDCSVQRWQPGLLALRELCRSTGMAEALRWGHPCYREGDRNVALIGALRGDFRLSFFEAALLTDPAHILQSQGPNSRHPDTVRFTDNEQVATLAPTLLAYLEEARDHARAGRKTPRDQPDESIPAELAEALASDPELAAAFAALTPGRRRSHALQIQSAKQAQTRSRRVATARPLILAGKGALER